MSHPTVTIETGEIVGVAENGVHRFLGVPYAEAPIGEKRFIEAQPHPHWDEPRDCARKGPSAPYVLGEFPQLDIEPLVGAGWDEGDDYLNLNVWTPVGAKAAPVMVFIHGGAFVGGQAMAPVQDGTAFARDGVVLITITYRLGIEGFLPIQGVPTNLGLRDQLAALAWIQRNAAAFGGDPANVTIFGESAGAMSVADLMVSPLAKGLFRRVIIQSGNGALTHDVSVAERTTKRVAKLLGIEPTVAGFRSTTMQEGLAALQKVSAPTAGLDMRGADGRDPAYGLSKFLPVHGDDVIPVPPLEAMKAGAARDIEMLIGTNSEEMNLYLVPTGVRDKLPGLMAWFALGKSDRQARKILKAYGLGKRKAGVVFGAAMADLVFRWPARAYAAAHRGKSWFYEFGWKSPACVGQLGACHGLELPFVFDTLSTATGPKGIAGEAPPQDLADYVHKVWVEFAKTGAAPWAEYTSGQRNVHELETRQTRVETDADFPISTVRPA